METAFALREVQMGKRPLEAHPSRRTKS
jgi:hypothetical protein